MDKIKNVKDLRKQQGIQKFSDDEIGKQLAVSIETNNDFGENKLTVYKVKHPSTARDYRYEYIKKHKRYLIGKGYKVHFNYTDALVGYLGYTIRW